MARPERFELPAPRFVVWCSIQLSYGRAVRRARHRGRSRAAQPARLRLSERIPRASRTMRAALLFPLLPSLALAACSTPGGPYPSLSPRAGETIDPRVPVNRPLNERPASAELVARLDSL